MKRSSDIMQALSLTAYVNMGVPWKASISRSACPLVEMRRNLPSELNFSDVQSASFSCGNLNVAKGPYTTPVLSMILIIRMTFIQA